MCQSSYICPFCTTHLNVEEKVVLGAKAESGQKGLIFLSTLLGDYAIEKNPAFDIALDSRLELHCPSCSQDLALSTNDNLCKLIRVDEDGEHTVLFSNKYGEKCTFTIKDEKATSYGEHAIRYQNPEWFLQSDKT